MKQGVNSIEMQKINRTLVLKELMENGSMMRTTLSAKIGLQKATITNIINEFLDLGIIEVDGEAASGRRGERICLNLREIYIMTIAVNRRDYHFGIYSLEGREIEHICYTFPLPRNLADILAQMKADGLQLLNKYGRKRFIGISMGLPGPYIRPVGCAPSEERMLVSGFEELSRINLRIELETAWDMEITTEHDAKLQAYAEWKTLQKERKNPSGSLIAVGSVGFGIGAGIIIGGKIVEGQLGVAGEIGHMGINFNGKYSAGQNQGTYEYAAGTDSAVRYMRERLYEFPDSPLSDDSSYQEILSAYHSGDPLAVYAVHKMAWMLGYGLANMIYMLNPDCIRIETDYPNSPEFLQKVEESVQRFVLPEIVETISITCSELRENAILLGGYYLILDRLFEENMFLDRIKQVLS